MKLKNFLSFLFVLCLLCIPTVSCESDEGGKNVDIKIPEAHFSYSTSASYGTFLTNGNDFQFKLSLTEASSKGLSISQVDYYWDGQKVATVGGDNLTLNYRIENQTIGEHHLKISAKCTGEGYSPTTFTFTLPFTVCETIPVIDFTDTHPKEVNRDGLLQCEVQPVENLAEGESISKVAYYLDDRLLMETAMAPYTLSCPVKSETLGEHNLSVSVTFKGIWDGQVTRTYPITIK